MTKYDEVRYPTFIHGQLNPDRLGTVGWLFGLDTAPAERCRYLELGCADAGTLIANAMALPDSRFVGVDLAATSVERANATIAAVGLENVDVLCADVTDLPEGLGEFDYIASHGVFSWVPEEARDGILTACRERLAPGGVAYVSYNANPAGHLREITRAMLRYHLSRRELEPEEALAESINLLGFLSDSRPDGDLWGEVLEGELAYLKGRHPAGLIHDELAEINKQFWFYEFVDLATKHRLQFLAESDDLGLPGLGWPDQVQDLFKALADDPIQREQYYDFVAARRFRQTLLCHDDAEVRRPVDPLRLRDCHILASTTPIDRVDLTRGVHMLFVTEEGMQPGSDGPLTKAALLTLGHRYPDTVPFLDLVAEARRLVGAAAGEPESDEADLASALLHLQATRCVWFSRLGRRAPVEASDHPVASSLVRYQLGEGAAVVSTLLVDAVELSEASQALCRLTDGSRDLMQLAVELGALGFSADPSDMKALLDELTGLGLFTA